MRPRGGAGAARRPDVAEQRPFRVLLVPAHRRALTKRNNRVPDDVEVEPLPRWRYWVDDELLSNGLFAVVNRFGRRRPALVPRSTRSRPGRCRRASTPTPRRGLRLAPAGEVRRDGVRRPAAALTAGAARDRSLDRVSGERMAFPVEVRFAAADDIWLSTALRPRQRLRRGAPVPRLTTRGTSPPSRGSSPSVDGRPHWGKLHSLDAERLGALYPRFADFLRVPGPARSRPDLRE